MPLVIATRNRHKLDEIRAILDFAPATITSALDYPDIPDVEESSNTFAGNALLKAHALAHATGAWTMADDSGLEVDALHGAPGIYSARFAGEPVDYAANNKKLLGLLEGVANRKACFRTVLALVSPDGRNWTVEGRCPGHIHTSPRGNQGFGYDPLFIPEGETLTFAEMPVDRKNRISHRARALEAARDAWRELLLAIR